MSEKTFSKWETVMSKKGESGIVEFTNRMFVKVQADGLRTSKDKDQVQQYSRNVEYFDFGKYGEPRTEYLSAWNSNLEVDLPEEKYHGSTIEPNDLERVHLRAFVDPNQDEPGRQAISNLITTGLYLKALANRITSSKPKGDNGGYNNDFDGLDMDSAGEVFNDNLQTTLDVFRNAVRFAETDLQITGGIEKLLYGVPHAEKSGVKLNPRNETNFQLLARAPFAFWAYARAELINTFNGDRVFNLQNDKDEFINTDFLYAITRCKPETANLGSTDDSFERHGGCPALHKNYAQHNLITRMGEMFLQEYKRMHKEGWFEVDNADNTEDE